MVLHNRDTENPLEPPMTLSPTRPPLRATHALRADLSGVPAADQIAFWEGVAPGSYSVRRQADAKAPLDVAMTAFPVGPVLATQFRSRAHLIVRSRNAIRRRRSDFVKLRLYTSGGARLTPTEGAGTYRLGPDAVHIIDQSRPWITEHDDHAQLTIFLRHQMIGFDPGVHPPVVSLPLSEPAGRLVGDAVRSFFRSASELCEQGNSAFSGGMIGLIRGVLDGGAVSDSDAGVRAARRRAMRRFLDKRLHEPSLGIDDLRQVFGASDATIYRDFADEGGVARYIFQRRLSAAFDELSTSAAVRGTVRSVAERWGFSSLSHFSHAFSQRFGMRPGEAVGIALNSLTDAPAEVSEPCTSDLDTVRMQLAALYAPFNA